MTRQTHLYLSAVIAAGAAASTYAAVNWTSNDVSRFVCYLAIAVLASSMKVSLPGITGTMSVSFLFILVGVVQMSLGESIAIGWASTLFQMFWRARTRPKVVKIAFNLGNMSTSITAAYLVYHAPLIDSPGLSHHTPVALLLAAVVYYACNTVPVAGAVSLTEGKSLTSTWRNCYFWSFPYYLVGASIAWLIGITTEVLGWYGAILVLPVLYFIHRSYRLYLGRLEDEKVHAEQMASLHLRTIEALALAIEAKDNTTHDHLQRVRVYAEEIGKELGLPALEMDALRAAALLHDIGKLAVPEHIISKPGRLTPEEFEKMKIHPIVGAEILERVQFPYPVVPIVAAHHEKWDGTGYPRGLRGSEIPIGARILSAVDCLDALASDRQYRRALPLDEAMANVASQAGSAFDPAVIEVLARRYRELETMAVTQGGKQSRLSTDVKIQKGDPAAGFEVAQDSANGSGRLHYLDTIAAARQEVQVLFEITRDLGNSLSLDETLSVLAVRLGKMIAYGSVVVWVKQDDTLEPRYVNGEDFRFLSSLRIPVGEGLSGWVAENRKPIVNGNPAVESGYRKDLKQFTTMRSALAVPLEGLNGLIGVLSLYSAERDYFSKDHLRILLAVSSKIGLSLENALRYSQVETSATTDYLTGLPNARSLSLRLEEELERCRRMGMSLGVMVCDLDGFKQINDRYGHLDGNKVLRLVGQEFRTSCRETDYVARMGGDEFVILLPGVTESAMQERILLLEEAAHRAGMEGCGAEWLGVSVGVAFLGDEDSSAEQLLAAADHRMYKNKQDKKTRRPVVVPDRRRAMTA